VRSVSRPHRSRVRACIWIDVLPKYISVIRAGPQFCSQFNPQCPNGYYCHLGAERDTTLCCPASMFQMSDRCTTVCLLPIRPNSTFAYDLSGAHDVCIIIGGVELDLACIRLVLVPHISIKNNRETGAGSPCDEPQERGTGVASLPRWYFDATTRRCLQFTYGGTKGNRNQFMSERECATECPGECELDVSRDISIQHQFFENLKI
jgi:hypothetical protein